MVFICLIKRFNFFGYLEKKVSCFCGHNFYLELQTKNYSRSLMWTCWGEPQVKKCDAFLFIYQALLHDIHLSSTFLQLIVVVVYA